MKFSIVGLGKVIIKTLLGLTYPPRCRLCGKNLDLFCKKVLCATCYGGIRLNTPFPYNDCKADKCYFEASYSVCIYDGVIRECVHKFKYSGRLGIEKLFEELMIDFAERHLDMRRFDWLVPVPLHRVKQKERSFNQSEILAVFLSKRFKIPMLNYNLIRMRMGEPQIMLPKYKRLKDIRGAFRIKNPNLIKNKRVLLIDDVLTTGATVNECSKVIKEAGAGAVEVFTLARSI